MLSAPVNCSFLFVLFVFVLCLVPNVICARELFILVCFVFLCSVPCTQCYLRLLIVHSCLFCLSLFCALYPMLSAPVNCSFLFVLFVFVLCLVPNVICARELFILVCFVFLCSVPCTQCYLRL